MPTSLPTERADTGARSRKDKKLKTDHLPWGNAALLAALAILGCAVLTPYGQLERSARRHYAIGDYDQAVLDCAQALKLNPGYAKAQTLIQDAFTAAVGTHSRALDALSSSPKQFKWDEIASEYQALILINRAVNELPTMRVEETNQEITFEVVDYSAELAMANEQAAEAHYLEGLLLSQEEGVDIQKQAAKEFKAAVGFIPEYKDAANLYEKARRAGIKRIALIPFGDKSGTGGKYGDISGLIVDDIVSAVMNDASAMEFLEIISRDQLETIMLEQDLGLTGILDEGTAVEVGKILGVHELLTGTIRQIIVTPASTVDKTVEQEAKIVVKREKYKDDEGKTKTRKIYGTVKAEATVYTRSTSAKITASYKVIDVRTAKLKLGDSFTGHSSWEHEWATYTGDKRALGWRIGRLAAGNEKPAPVQADMVNRAAKSLSTSLAATLTEYAR